MFHLLAVFVLAAIATVQGQDLPPDCTRNATVVIGDTCYDISAKYNVSTYQLAAVNKDVINPACDNLHPDQVLCLGLKGQDCTETYVVQYGDTCPGIAYTYNVSVNTIDANNPGQCSNLKAKESLCVSSTIYPYNTTQAA